MKYLLSLDLDERLALVEQLWDSIAAESERVPLHEWQKRELDRRLENAESDPEAGDTWEDVRDRTIGHFAVRNNRPSRGGD